MDKELIETLKYLHLGGLLTHWDEYLALALKQRFSPCGSCNMYCTRRRNSSVTMPVD